MIYLFALLLLFKLDKNHHAFFLYDNGIHQFYFLYDNHIHQYRHHEKDINSVFLKDAGDQIKSTDIKDQVSTPVFMFNIFIPLD